MALEASGALLLGPLGPQRAQKRPGGLMGPLGPHGAHVGPLGPPWAPAALRDLREAHCTLVHVRSCKGHALWEGTSGAVYACF